MTTTAARLKKSRPTAGHRIACVCCIDLGTTIIKAGLYDEAGDGLLHESGRAPAVSAWHGIAVFDLTAYLDQAVATLRRLMRRARRADQPVDILALVPTGQRATIIGLDSTAQPATPALCWQGDCTGKPPDDLLPDGMTPDRFRDLTGLPPIAVLSVFNLRRLHAASGGRPAGVTRYALVQDAFLNRMGAPDFHCDPSHAAATGLYDPRTATWHPDLLQAAQIDGTDLPTIVPATQRAGTISPDGARQTGLPIGLPLLVGGADQPCSTLAAGVVDRERIAVNLGTAGFVMQGDDALDSTHPGFYRLPHVLPGRRLREGLIPAVGASLEWIRRITAAGDYDTMHQWASQSPAGSRGVRFQPFLAGTGTPDYNTAASGGFDGLREIHDRADLVRAVMEGLACEIRRVMDAFDPAHRADAVISGNVCRCAIVRSSLAGLCERRLLICRDLNSSLLGAAMVGWTGLDRFASLETAIQTMSARHLEPVPPPPDNGLRARYPDYLRRVQRVRRATPADRSGNPTGAGIELPRNVCGREDEIIRKAMDLADIAFYCYRPDGTLTHIDRRSVKILDLAETYPDPSVLVGKNISDLFQRIRPEGDLRNRILRDGKAAGYEYPFRTLSGNDRWTLHDSFLDVDPETGGALISAMVRDITDRKRAEIELQQRSHQLARLASELIVVEQRERGRIALLLHDNLQQLLVGLRMHAVALMGHLDASNQTRLETIQQAIDETLRETQAITRIIAPPLSLQQSLPDSLRCGVHEMQQRLLLETTLHFGAIPNHLSEATAVLLYTAARELLLNVVKHAGVLHADLNLEQDGDRIRLTVSDQGRGMITATRRSDDASSGFGLFSIRERAELLGGTFAVESVDGAGTRVILSLPCPTVTAMDPDMKSPGNRTHTDKAAG